MSDHMKSETFYRLLKLPNESSRNGVFRRYLLGSHWSILALSGRIRATGMMEENAEIVRRDRSLPFGSKANMFLDTLFHYNPVDRMFNKDPLPRPGIYQLWSTKRFGNGGSLWLFISTSFVESPSKASLSYVLAAEIRAVIRPFYKFASWIIMNWRCLSYDNLRAAKGMTPEASETLAVFAYARHAKGS